MAEVIDGKKVAQDVVAKVKELTAGLSASGKGQPGLAVVIVGEDPASQVYVASKSRTAKECGFLSVQHTLPADTDEQTLLKLIGDLNADPAIHGILVQLPLPSHIDSGKSSRPLRRQRMSMAFTSSMSASWAPVKPTPPSFPARPRARCS